VIVEYLETNGDAANGISRFTSAVSGLSGITAASLSAGGSPEESVSRIKFLAPKFYTAQSRAVTEDDYTAIVQKEYPNTDSVYVYGGENMNPPQYGKVMIAVKPKSGSALTREEKTSLVSLLKKNRSVVTVTPEIVDPDYTDLIFNSTVTYDPKLTSIGAGTLKALVVAYCFTYSSSVLEKFGSNFYLSKMIQGINELNGSILSNETTVFMRKAINLSKLSASKGIAIDFKNPIHMMAGSVKSSFFSHRDLFGVLKSRVSVIDDGEGVLNLVSVLDDGSEKIEYPAIGSVDYMSGMVRLNTNFSPAGNELFFILTAEPEYTDLYVVENSIFRINRGYSDSVSVGVTTATTRKATL
jgi:hypothetical protein